MIPVTIPLTQNIGLSILQAKNKYKYRTMIFFGIAILNVLVSIPLAKMYGGIGSAIGTAASLIIGQIIILNIYYHKAIHINMIEYWKNILKMTLPMIICFTIGWIINHYIPAIGIIKLVLEIGIYCIIYSLIAWLFIMNNYEKDLIKKPINKILNKLKKNAVV